MIQARAIVARIIDGKAIARWIEEDVRSEIARLPYRPGLVAVRVGHDPASEIYVRNKARKAEELGLRGVERVFLDTLSEQELLGEIARLNDDAEVDGILVQLPLPKQIRPQRIIEAIDPAKDVDGFHPINVGLLHLGRATLVPCTPAGVIHLLDAIGEPIEGRHAVVVGRSDIVGKPAAALLLQRNATVTICHSRTKDLARIVRGAEILVAALGKPLAITGEMIGEGAIVIDVGVNRIDAAFASRLTHDEQKARALAEKGQALVGDVDFAAAKEKASWITPVPGGVGPMTIAMLMKNTLTAARARRH